MPMIHPPEVSRFLVDDDEDDETVLYAPEGGEDSEDAPVVLAEPAPPRALSWPAISLCSGAWALVGFVAGAWWAS